ncbi:hypothetical protein CIT26_24445 [Mesorhizobium temperatum]|uniref:Uncharacterized protein n=2 Tax=Mesorhizobium temperatum TaxID=241416 RepID=A0A271LF32_9HYPH|nr:hypothetical protein CIT26_24445 [Mesorhizobium temperatum]
MPSWLSKNETQKGSVWIEGALFAHPDPKRLYFMSEASGPGVRFELYQTDIVDVADSAMPIKFLDQEFPGVRIQLKLDAVVTRLSGHIASGLVEYGEGKITNIAGDTMMIKNTVLASVVMR